MSTDTALLSVNAAFFQEIKDDNRELQQAFAQLQRLLDRPKPFRLPVARLADLLVDLRDRLAMHFSLEETYGYFDDAISAAPRLTSRAHKLQAEHNALFDQISEIVENVEEVQYHERVGVDGDQIVNRCLAFHRAFQAHEERENELILEAFDDDIGVGD